MPDITIRAATETDGPLLAQIERESPMVFGASQLAIDRGSDYFAATRFMEDVLILLAEVDGEPAGVFCGARHRAIVGGRERWLLYVHHARILPRFQRLGLGRKLAGELQERFAGRVDSQYWYIGRANERSQAFAAGAANKWSFPARFLHLDVAEAAGPRAGRTATPADGAELAAIFNAGHEGEEMFLPHTPERLAARLTRAPRQYSWADLRITGGAAVGVWLEAEWVVTRLRDPAGNETVSRGALLMDYGCLPGGEAALAGLLRGVCAELAARGYDSLSAFTSAGARLEPVLAPLAVDEGLMDFWTPSIPEPPEARAHGLYVDPVYF